MATDYDPYSPPEAPIADPEPDRISLAEFEAFTGKGKYANRFYRFHIGETKKLGFNTWAAIFGAQWFAFRKLYPHTLAVACIEFGIPGLTALLVYMTDRGARGSTVSVLVLLAFLIARVGAGFFANIALYWQAERVIRKIDLLNFDNETHLHTIGQRGGVSVPALLLVYVVLGILTIALRGSQ